MSFPPKSTAARILWVVCIALLFIVVFAPLASSPENPLAVRVNSSVDRKITTTLELAGASSAAALAVSAIPDDTATPIAEKLADFGSGFLLVLCVLYFEKMMFGAVGYILCALIVPAVLVLYLLSEVWRRRALRIFAGCLLASGILIWLMVPAGLWVSDFVYETQHETVQEIIASAGDLSLEVEEGSEEMNGEEDGNMVEKIMTRVSSFSAEMVRKAKRLITGFLRALALMIVTACVIPLAVMAVFVWIIKLIFQLGFSLEYPEIHRWERPFRREERPGAGSES